MNEVTAIGPEGRKVTEQHGGKSLPFTFPIANLLKRALICVAESDSTYLPHPNIGGFMLQKKN